MKKRLKTAGLKSKPCSNGYNLLLISLLAVFGYNFKTMQLVKSIEIYDKASAD